MKILTGFVSLMFLYVCFAAAEKPPAGAQGESLKKDSPVTKTTELRRELSIGKAYNKKGELAYTETHVSEFTAEGDLKTLNTTYTDSEGKEFGSISSDFTRRDHLPAYLFEDRRSGRSVQVRWQGDAVEAEIQKGHDKDKKKKSYQPKDNTTAGQGLYNLFRMTLESFIENPKDTQKIDFLVPLSETSYGFRVKLKAMDSEQETVTLRAEAGSFLFRLVAPHIDVTYDLKTRRLLRYDGPSNLLDAGGKTMSVVIDYEYPESTSLLTGSRNP